MTTYILTILILTLGLSVSGQNLTTIQPTVSYSNAYSKADQLIWQKAIDQLLKINSGDIKYGQLSEQDKIVVDSLEMGYGPMTQGAGCSWYCGGGPYKITSSKYLNDEGKITYMPANIHDFDLFTAWVPENSEGAIGKKINFHFKPFSPRVNEIIIWNGYIKNSDLWQANSRVAKFKMIINGKPTAILKLLDVNKTQTFKIDPIQSTDSTKDLILTLEILEVYKGTKYNDVAISEINFDGLDVHCFGAGTKITMANNSTKNIEQITKNDWVMTIDNAANKLVKTQVSELIQARHSNLLKLKFVDREIITTDDHPFWTADKNWASINPTKSNNNYDQDTEVKKLIVGDKIFVATENKFIDLIEIEEIEGVQMTFTMKLTTGNNFIANGLLVKTERPKWTN
ncbi:MAG: Hint domain-containing protein [Bacteroidota bacterium]